MNQYAQSYRTMRAQREYRRARIVDLVIFCMKWFRLHCSEYLAGALTGLGIISTLSCTPSLFMSHSFEQSGIQLLSDGRLPGNPSEIVCRTYERIAASGLYRPDTKFKIYLCNSHWIYLLASSFSMNSKGIHVTTTGRIMIDMKNINGKDDLVRCIAHEITHDMVQNRLGWRVFMTPKWVSEGYAEYVAKRNWSSWEARRELLQLRSVDADAEDYGRYRLLVTYALDVWKVPLDDLLRKPPAMRELLFAMRAQTMAWLFGNIVGNSNESYRNPGPFNSRKTVTGILIISPG